MPEIKPPLDSTGIDAKLTELYALSDTDLRAEAELIRTDFPGWLADNFDLTTDQETYLGNLDSKFMEFLADISYVCVKNRQSYTFNPPSSPDISKRLDLSGNFSGSFIPVPSGPPMVDIGGLVEVEGTNPPA